MTTDEIIKALAALPLPDDTDMRQQVAIEEAHRASIREHERLGRMLGQRICKRFRDRVRGVFDSFNIEARKGYSLDYRFRGPVKHKMGSAPTKPHVTLMVYIWDGNERVKFELECLPVHGADMDAWVDKWVDRLYAMGSIRDSKEG